MATRRTRRGWTASNGRTYRRRKDAIRAGRQGRTSSTAQRRRKARDRRRMKGIRRTR